MNVQREQRGVTLIELVITIVVVALAAGAILGTLSVASTGSADAVVRHQSIALANAYLEEILLKAMSDPDGASEADRTLYDDVRDYDGLVDDGARDQFDEAISGLEQYRVEVDVVDETVSGVAALRVDVDVTHVSGTSVRLSGYRMR